METESYHYIESGLDNVWLHNGYDVDQDADFENLTRLMDVNGLHRSIAKTLLIKTAPLFGSEFKFLRTHCSLSQGDVADTIEITEEDVFKIEELSDKPVDSWQTDVLFRVYISRFLDDEVLAKRIEDNLQNLGRETPVAARIIMRKADEWTSEVIRY